MSPEAKERVLSRLLGGPIHVAGAISSNQVVAEVVAGVIMAEVTAKTFSPEKTKHAPQPVPKGVL